MALQLQRRLAAVTLGGLANAHASTSRATTSHIFSLASTPTASSSTPSPFRSFHSSPPTLEKRKKRVARLRKKANLSKREEAQAILVRTAPDPVRGYGPGNENLWLDSPLRSILLDRNVVYSGRAGEVYKMLERPVEERKTEKDVSSEGRSEAAVDVNVTERASMSEAESKAFGELENQAEEPTSPSQDATDIAESEAADTALEKHASSEPAPVYLNFGLDPSDSSLLFEQLPRAAAHGALTERNNLADTPDAVKEQRMQAIRPAHEHQADALRRIVDLRNTNADGIRFENTRRVVDHFGVHGGTGSPEVQAALFTMRIHNIADSMAQQPRDVHAKRHLRRLVMSRAKILRYLKQRDLNRYVACLKDIGVEERAVLGDIIVR